MRSSMTSCGKVIVACLALAIVLLQQPASHASSYPPSGKTVTILVPYPAGGSGDILGRAIGEVLARQLSGTFIIQNVAGGSQTIASQRLARATPDGLTLMVGTVTNLAINPTMKTKLGYDPLKDFEPISLTMVAPQYLIASPKFPASTIGELIVASKKSPGKFTYGSPGPGTSPHVAAELMAHRAGISMRHVPYTGAAPAFRDVMAGHIDMMFTTSVMSSVKAGQVKALGVAGGSRMPIAPGDSDHRRIRPAGIRAVGLDGGHCASRDAGGDRSHHFGGDQEGDPVRRAARAAWRIRRRGRAAGIEPAGIPRVHRARDREVERDRRPSRSLPLTSRAPSRATFALQGRSNAAF